MRPCFPVPVNVPYVTATQMAALDRIITDDLGVDLLQMMENAGRHLAHLARQRFLAGTAQGRQVIVLAGSGGNGGGALAGARRLQGWGARVQILLAGAADSLAPTTSRQLAVAQRLGIPVTGPDAACSTRRADLIVDGLIGYGLVGTPRPPAAGLIRWANGLGAPILALDVPSGLDATTGMAFDPTIRATATLTLALPKTGLRAAGAAEHVGELYLADIGVPPAAYARIGLDAASVFSRADLLRLE